jgi:hypothetical protein
LKTPTKKFSDARISRNSDQRLCSTVSPPSRLAPTTLIGVSGSRSPPVIAVHSLGSFSGTFFIASQVPTKASPVNPTALEKPSTGP